MIQLPSRCTEQIITQLIVVQPGSWSDGEETLLSGVVVTCIVVVVVVASVVDACDTYTQINSVKI